MLAVKGPRGENSKARDVRRLSRPRIRDPCEISSRAPLLITGEARSHARTGVTRRSRVHRVWYKPACVARASSARANASARLFRNRLHRFTPGRLSHGCTRRQTKRCSSRAPGCIQRARATADISWPQRQVLQCFSILFKNNRSKSRIHCAYNELMRAQHLPIRFAIDARATLSKPADEVVSTKLDGSNREHRCRAKKGRPRLLPTRFLRPLRPRGYASFICRPHSADGVNDPEGWRQRLRLHHHPLPKRRRNPHPMLRFSELRTKRTMKNPNLQPSRW
jgi:hypothetical protein